MILPLYSHSFRTTDLSWLDEQLVRPEIWVTDFSLLIFQFSKEKYCTVRRRKWRKSHPYPWEFIGTLCCGRCKLGRGRCTCCWRVYVHRLYHDVSLFPKRQTWQCIHLIAKIVRTLITKSSKKLARKGWEHGLGLSNNKFIRHIQQTPEYEEIESYLVLVGLEVSLGLQVDLQMFHIKFTEQMLWHMPHTKSDHGTHPSTRDRRITERSFPGYWLRSGQFIYPDRIQK